MMNGIEIVFFLLYCGLAVALALWASRVRMRSATPFSLTKLAFGHSGKGGAVPVAAVRAVALHGNTETPAGYAVASPHPDQGLITALPMEVTAVVTAVSSDSVLWSL
jgi:hypothetical protein